MICILRMVMQNCKIEAQLHGMQIADSLYALWRSANTKISMTKNVMKDIVNDALRSACTWREIKNSVFDFSDFDPLGH